MFFKTKFGDVLTKLRVSTRFQLAIYSVCHEKSESEVQHTKSLPEHLNISISNFHFFIFKPDQGVIALHGLGFGRNLGEILPTSLPELPIQLRDLRNNQKS